ncbi:pseudaminic acid synthase [Deltaproteobacteria bacterium OttesenSCG-928-K17]|nr:pseudaminic acid synthase [Deltaproteobacteria bacterium OttesenSCG-928-K17]
MAELKNCYLVAELSANHNHDLSRAKRLVEAAAAAGADAVKLQTYTADTLTIDCDNDYFRIKGTMWNGRTLHDLYKEAYTPWEWHAPLKELAESLGLDFFSTPFDATAVDFLEELGCSIYKVASFELVDLPLLRKIAATGKPVIMSTGMATLGEIEEAVNVLKNGGAGPLTLLKCTSAYPAPPEAANLRAMTLLAEIFNCTVGLSDHTMGSAAAVAAVALGAKVIEKHFTLDRADGGPDGSFSMEPDEFRRLATDVRTAEKALGRPTFDLGEKERESQAFRRSLFVVEDMKAGETFTERNVRSIRPGDGLHTRHLPEVLTRRAARDIPRGTPLSWGLIG